LTISRGARKVPTRWTRPQGSQIIGSISDTFALWGARIGDEVDPGDVKGTKLKILKYPHPKLRTENTPVTVFGEDLRRIASEMLLVMRAADGIGLAAPQVGINQRLMVFNEFADSGKSDMILANPGIISKSEETDSKEEGCLSFPQINGDVIRSKWIEVEYTTVSGDKVQKRFEGLAARIFQHEYDHLDKVLFIDRFGEKDKAMNSKRLEKYVKKYGPGGIP
jgi:peptide deformylase